MAIQINRILVPTDGSELALKAAAFAGDLARALNAKVTVAIVHRDEAIQADAWGPGAFPMGSSGAPMSAEEVRTKIEARAQKSEVASTLAAVGTLPKTPEVVQLWGHPSEQLLSFAAKMNADLIVMGSHGRSGLKRVLLGSVSNAIANQAHCPVTIVR